MEHIILTFSDYHAIRDDDKEYKAIELGCFPIKKYDYCRYVGLFYKGRRPSLKKIMEKLDKIVEYGGITHYYTGEFIDCKREDVIEEVKHNLQYRLDG